MASHADRSLTVPNRIFLPTIAALAFAGACGSTEPRVDATPATITGTPTDTIHATVGSTVVTPLAVVVKNKAGSPIEYLDAPEFQTYWDADAAEMTKAVRAVGKVE